MSISSQRTRADSSEIRAGIFIFMDTGETIMTLTAALLGGGGIAAFVRARGQNRIDLFAAQSERLAKVEQRADDLDRRNDALVAQNVELIGTIGGMKTRNEMLSQQLDEQRTLVHDLRERIAHLEAMEAENASLRQQLQIEQSKREFLEREINALRTELARQRGAA